ncbi:MAG: hypothetical protein JW892_02000 [Anaerolineae bacterium]|nr:hypothetical protein [Anaerolineae bacterium]
MKIHPQATKGHLIVGSALILLSPGSLIASFFLDTQILPFLVFFLWRLGRGRNRAISGSLDEQKTCVNL